MNGCGSLPLFPNWAPAFAGVVLGLRGSESNSMLPSPFLFSREGGSPVWVPAFAGKQSWGVLALAAPC